jgi:tetratricopeptide (TPR) repeat protein
MALYGVGFDQGALYLAEQAVWIAEYEHPAEPLTLAYSLDVHAYVHPFEDNPERKLDLLRRALAVRKTAPHLPKLELIDHIMRLANYERFAEQEEGPSPSLLLYTEAVDLIETNFGPYHPKLIEPLHRIGVHYQESGDFAQAESYHVRAVEIAEVAYGASHRQTATALNHLIAFYEHAAQTEAEERTIQRQLSIRLAHAAQDPDLVANSLCRLADFYTRQGQYAKAESLFERCISFASDSPAPNTELAHCQERFAAMFLANHQPENALRWLLAAQYNRLGTHFQG